MPIIDPVCHREIDDVEYPEQLEYNGKTYWFCSLGDAQKFAMHPEQYAGQDEDEDEDSLE